MVLGIILILIADCDVNEITVLQDGVRSMEPRVTLIPDDVLETPGYLTELCMSMPEGYSIDRDARCMRDQDGRAICVRAEAYLVRGGRVNLNDISGLQQPDRRNVCLSDLELKRGDLVRRVDVFSSRPWRTRRIEWLSRDKF